MSRASQRRRALRDVDAALAETSLLKSAEDDCQQTSQTIAASVLPPAEAAITVPLATSETASPVVCMPTAM